MAIEINGWVETGLLCALFISVVPAYLSRSVAGSYDNEAISITLLLLTFYFFLKGCRTGKLKDGSIGAILYSYLVSSWGGYSFPIAFIPLYVLFCLFTNHYSFNMYKNYTQFYLIAQFWSMQTQFINFKIWHKSEHLGSHMVFILI